MNIIKDHTDLKRPGRRVTDQRRIVLEIVRGTDTHPTAEWVYRKVRRRLRRISRGTVYRNLKFLAGQGLIGVIRELDRRGSGRYDGNIVRHHHFTCQACGRISDVAGPVNRGVERRAALRTGLEIWHHRIEFYGRCLACCARKRRRVRGRRSR